MSRPSARPARPLPRAGQPPVRTRHPTAAPADTDLQAAIEAFQAGELQRAQQALTPHLARQPESWTGLCLQAVLAARTHRGALAEALWSRLLQRAPDWVEGRVNLGLLQRGQGRLDEAAATLRRALAHDAAHAGAWHNLGLVLSDQGDTEAALEAYERARQLRPGDAQTPFCIGVLWQHRLEFDRAVAAYRQALALDPGHAGAGGNLVFCLQYLPQAAADERLAQARAVGQALSAAARRAATGGPGTAAGDGPAAAPARPADRRRGAPRSAGRPLRVGLLSGDLRAHPVGFFLLPLLEGLDDPALTLHAYDNHARAADASDDAVTRRLRARCASWCRVDAWSDAELARRIDADAIDVLVDLAGHSALNRLGVFARRPAPLQLSWLGWFATTGLPEMDAVLADPVCVPAGEERWFTEPVARLPLSRLCFSPPDDAPDVSPPPCLRQPRFTFGCYQELAKINDDVLATWARVLKAVPHAVLRLQSARLAMAPVRERFIARALAAGIPAAALQLHGPMPRADYLASHAEVDVLLDTFPYPGGTTTCEALWMGVPTLTLARPGMLGRQGEGLLTAAGLPRWVARDEDDYVAKAVRCASPRPAVRQGLAELRAGLRAHLPRTPLFDGRRHARDWAHTLQRLWAAPSPRTVSTMAQAAASDDAAACA